MLQASTGTSSPRPHKSQSVCFFLIAFIANLTLFAYICNVMNKLSRLKYFMTFGIWNREEHENGWCKRTGLNVVRKMYMAIRLFIERGHVDYATQLSFSTILAIVPIFAMIFAIGRGFGLSKYIETWLRSTLDSQPQAAESIISLADSYLQHAQTGLFIGIGLLFMLYSVLSLIYNVENVFNIIWQVERKRSVGRFLADNLSMMFLVPVIIIVMSGVSIIANTTTDHLQAFIILGPIARILVKLLPFVVLTLIFIALFVVMPNTRVKFSAAVGPAILAAILMLLVQWGYVHGQLFLSGYNAVYGSLAALPLFMLWMQISWYICLFCAELCYMNQYLDYYEYMISPKDISEANRRKIALLVMRHIIKRFSEGRPALTVLEIKQLTGIPIRLVCDALTRLEHVKLVTVVGNSKDEDTRYQPAQSLNYLRMGRIVELLDNDSPDRHKNNHIDISSTLNDEAAQEVRRAREEFIQKLDDINDL